MLRNVTIQNYRAFEHFSIERLAPVNLIVGTNNVGKTSLLEAIYLLVNQDNPLSLLETLHYRGEFIVPSNQNGSLEYHIAYLFRDHDPKPNLKMPRPTSIISIWSHHNDRPDVAVSMRVSPTVVQSLTSEQVRHLDGVVESQPLFYELLFAYGPDAMERITGVPAGTLPVIPVSRDYTVPGRAPRVRNRSSQHYYLTPNDPDYAVLADMWDRIALTPRESKVVEALRVVEPSVERLGFTSHRRSSGGILVKLSDQTAPVPLSSMGDGMRRMLLLAISAICAENGVLLVDEIDTGLYHGVQADMWRVLIETAQRLNVQIFATTHSWDCVAAFQEVLSQTEGDEPVGRLFRLQLRDDGIRTVRYEVDDLAIAVREGIEVR